MANYSRYRTATLERMKDAAYEKYMQEANKPIDGWGTGMRCTHLSNYKGWERAKERYEAICTEIKRRTDYDAKS